MCININEINISGYEDYEKNSNVTFCLYFTVFCVYCVMFCRPLFVLFVLAIVFSVLFQFTHLITTLVYLKLSDDIYNNE